MEATKLEHFKQLLLAELLRHTQNVSDEQAAALDAAGDDAKESVDFALRDGIEEMALPRPARAASGGFWQAVSVVGVFATLALIAAAARRARSA